VTRITYAWVLRPSFVRARQSRAGLALKIKAGWPLSLAMARATPSKIGRFDIERVLGSSARGAVYTAQQAGGGQRVVIRTLPADVTRATAGPLTCILQSAATLGELTHPGILPLLETGQAGGLPYLVYEHVDGELLSELLGGGRQLPAARALEITIQILKAVGSAHHHGIVHRDLRPENIILASEDAPRLLGFGLSAWILENSPRAAGFYGDPAYTDQAFDMPARSD